MSFDRIKQRNSNLELFRIVTMLAIIAHHYVVNSNLLHLMEEESSWNSSVLFLFLFGWGGKTGINCFIMITGYFMCLSNISIKKFLKLLFQIEFYNILIYCSFLVSGYIDFSVTNCAKSILPITSIQHNFTGCFLIFYLAIPFLNILIKGLSQKQHLFLLLFFLSFFTILPQMQIHLNFSYVSWFTIVYFIAAYIRKWPIKHFEDKNLTALGLFLSLGASFGSVTLGYWFFLNTGRKLWYYFVSDCNSILAVITAFFAFLFFKNLNIGYSKFINVVAASAFGVFLIHTNGDAMRHWLWYDLFRNTEFFGSKYLIVHAFLTILLIYIFCFFIDFLRIHSIEKIFLRLINKNRFLMRIEEKLKLNNR